MKSWKNWKKHNFRIDPGGGPKNWKNWRKKHKFQIDGGEVTIYCKIMLFFQFFQIFFFSFFSYFSVFGTSPWIYPKTMFFSIVQFFLVFGIPPLDLSENYGFFSVFSLFIFFWNVGTCTGSMPATIRTSSKYISTLGLKNTVKNHGQWRIGNKNNLQIIMVN